MLVETKDQNRSYLEELKALGIDADQMWLAYRLHRKSCKNRLDRNGDAVEFLMTFREWAALWLQTDANGVSYWDNRGTKNASNYVMSRKGDVGNYEVENVVIQTHSQNVVEAREWQWNDTDYCATLSAIQKEVWSNQELRQRLSEAKQKSFETADADKKARMLRGAKATSKSINYYGTIYPSASECARAVGLTQQTISYHANNNNNLNVFYI